MVYDILRVTKKKKQGFTRFLENTFLENPQGDQIYYLNLFGVKKS